MAKSIKVKEVIEDQLPEPEATESVTETPVTEEPVAEIPKPEPIIAEPAKPVKPVVEEPEEIKFLRTLVHTQYHGGRGSYLNAMIIERAKSVLKTESVFIENGEIIT